MRWTYCVQWNYVLNRPLTPFKEEEARRRHSSGELYTAVGEESGQSRVLVHVRLENGYVGIKFLDDRGRDSLIYHFSASEDSRLFLSEIISYTYGGEVGAKGRVPLVVESYTFTPGGICRHEIDDSRVDMIKTVDRDSVDVTTHWEPIPEFGSYESVSRYERD